MHACDVSTRRLGLRAGGEIWFGCRMTTISNSLMCPIVHYVSLFEPKPYCVFTPRACARDKAIGFVRLSVSTKIASSGDLGVIAYLQIREGGKMYLLSLLGA